MTSYLCYVSKPSNSTNLYVIFSRSGDSGLPASLQNVYRTPVHSSGGSTSSKVRWHRSCSVRETVPIGPSEFLELYRSRAYSDPRLQDRNSALAERRRRVMITCCLCTDSNCMVSVKPVKIKSTEVKVFIQHTDLAGF